MYSAGAAPLSARPQQLELRLWACAGDHAVRPLERRMSVPEVLSALEPVLGRIDRHTVYDLIRAGRLDSIQPGAVLRGREARNHAHRVCPRSLERLVGELQGKTQDRPAGPGSKTQDTRFPEP